MNPDLPEPQRPEPGDLAAAEINACWKTIGVLGGDQSCPELSRFTHCRNCPVHAEAGARLLDRALPAGYREEWTRRLAERKADAAVGKKSAVIFRVGSDWLALPTQVLQHAVERRVIRSLPHQRCEFVTGLVAVRGELLICFSLPKLIGLSESSETLLSGHATGRLLITGWQGSRQAFPADEVFGVHRFLAQDLKPPVAFLPGSAFLHGLLEWEGHSVGLLNEQLLFTTFNQLLL